MLLLGVYSEGDIWSELKDLSDDQRSRLTSALATLGLELNVEPRGDGKFGGRFWYSSGQKADWRDLDPEGLAEQIRGFLDHLNQA